MIFGFGKKDKAAKDAEAYMRAMFAGLQTPNQGFGDAYVVAFLQTLVLHATMVVYKGRLPDQITVAGIMAAACDKMVPGYGLQIVRAAVDVANPAHPLHGNYSVGRREGNQYVVALLNGDLVSQTEMMRSFRDFLARNYGAQLKIR